VEEWREAADAQMNDIEEKTKVSTGIQRRVSVQSHIQ
jgi:hypothetical protein